MNKTSIEYLDYTWNPLAMRCTPCSSGCLNCWHLQLCRRLGNNPKIDAQHRNAYNGLVGPQLIQKELGAPLRKKIPARIGVQFMGDLFHKDVQADYIDQIFNTIYDCPHHTFLILTKRPHNIEEKLRVYYANGRRRLFKNWCFPANVWLGVTVCNQQEKSKTDILRQIPAAIRFISFEPLLADIGGINFDGISWTIIGGETGPGARPMHPEWVRSLRDQCQASGTPYFFKQWGEWEIASEENGHYCSDMEQNAAYWVDTDGKMAKPSWHDLSGNAYAMVKVGKKKAGRLLDGREWNQYPQEAGCDR